MSDCITYTWNQKNIDVECLMEFVSVSRWRCPDPGCKKFNAGTSMACSQCALPRRSAQQFQKKGKNWNGHHSAAAAKLAHWSAVLGDCCPVFVLRCYFAVCPAAIWLGGQNISRKYITLNLAFQSTNLVLAQLILQLAFIISLGTALQKWLARASFLALLERYETYLKFYCTT